MAKNGRSPAGMHIMDAILISGSSQVIFQAIVADSYNDRDERGGSTQRLQ